MSHYIAIFDRAKDGTFGVTFPDAPGCTSAGATQDEAYRNAIEALHDWAEVRQEHCLGLPVARDIGALLADPDVKADVAAGAAMIAVPCVARYGRTVRVQVTMDEGTLAAIDRAANLTAETRSGFLARVARDAAIKVA